MKKITITANIIMTLMACIMNSSCVDCYEHEYPVIAANTIEGQWQGDFGMYYDYEFEGRIYSFNSYDSDVVFYSDYPDCSAGTGCQVDYYETGPCEKISLKFDWQREGGRIYLHYPGHHEYDCCLYDYCITPNSFYGYIAGSEWQFDLKRVNKYNNWSVYTCYEIHFWPYADWDFYLYTRGAGNKDNPQAKVDSISSGEGKIIKIGRRTPNTNL